MSILGIGRRSTITPDPQPQPYTPPPPPDPEPDCICKPFDGPAQNPTCPTHPWWRNDPTVLHLADLTEARVPAWEAALKTYGGAQ